MKRSIVFGLGAVLALSACSDAAGPEGDRLTRAEALVLAAQVLATSEGAMTGSVSAASQEAAGQNTAGAPTSFTHTHQSSHPCPSGGTLDVDLMIDGMFDDETNSIQADLDGSHTHNDCAFPHQNLTLTVNGAPAISFSASIGAVDGVPSQPFTFSLDGGFAWSASDGRAGSCPIELDAVTDFTGKQRTVNGVICGHTISEVTTWS